MGNLSYSKLNEELEKEFGAKGTGYNISEEAENPWVITVESVEYTLNHTDITDDVLLGFGTVNEEYKNQFGYLVTGYNPTGGSNWRLFYADSNSAYLISDSIGNKSLNSFSWFGTSEISELGQNLNKKYTQSLSWSLEYDSIKGVVALLDETKWTDYKTNDANWAVGAPTLEMFVASYNATHSTKNIQIGCNIPAINSAGYWVGINTSGGTVTDYTTSITGLGNTDDIDRAIYAPASGSWWLASPSTSSDCCLYVDSWPDGGIQYYNSSFGVRPLISIPIAKIKDGTITITNAFFNN